MEQVQPSIWRIIASKTILSSGSTGLVGLLTAAEWLTQDRLCTAATLVDVAKAHHTSPGAPLNDEFSDMILD